MIEFNSRFDKLTDAVMMSCLEQYKTNRAINQVTVWPGDPAGWRLSLRIYTKYILIEIYKGDGRDGDNYAQIEFDHSSDYMTGKFIDNNTHKFSHDTYRIQEYLFTNGSKELKEWLVWNQIF